MEKIQVRVGVNIKELLGPMVVLASFAINDVPHSRLLLIFGKKVFEWKV